MARLIESPARIRACGNKPKVIREYAGRVRSGTDAVSIALMDSPGGWREPGQTPEFDEYTVVLSGQLTVETRSATYQVKPGQGIIVERGEWVRYSTPRPGGARYLAVCLPAFNVQRVHRDK